MLILTIDKRNPTLIDLKILKIEIIHHQFILEKIEEKWKYSFVKFKIIQIKFDQYL